MSPSVDEIKSVNNLDNSYKKSKVFINNNNQRLNLPPVKCACSYENNNGSNKTRYKRSNSECDIRCKKFDSNIELFRRKNRADTLSTLDILKQEKQDDDDGRKSKSAYNRFVNYLKKLKRSISSK